MLENLMDANGTGLICETEADTVSTAIGTDYGHWSDTLRKSFDHDAWLTTAAPTTNTGSVKYPILAYCLAVRLPK